MATAKTEANDIFETLRLVDVSEHVEEKDTGKAKLKYLSWAWAWHEVRRRCPNATYTIIKNEQGLPYFVDPQMGIMVYTTVTIGDETHEMWLPVMDGANNPMRLEPYDITMKWGKKHVEAATMFDINKTVMRCLTKNLAMFGIGLALYAGEDLFDDPEGNKGTEAVDKKSSAPAKASKAVQPVELQEQIRAVLRSKLTDAPKETKEQITEQVKNIIGMADYTKCGDVAKLTALLNELQAG